MSAEQIAAVLAEHGWVTPPKGECACLCGWQGRLAHHRAHVAEVIVTLIADAIDAVKDEPRPLNDDWTQAINRCRRAAMQALRAEVVTP